MSEAIERRLDRISDQWTEVAEDDRARCLHWLIEPDEWRMLDLFFTVEDTPDAFFVLDAAFEDERTHGLRLRQWLVDQYRIVEPALAEEGVQTGWCPPPVGAGEDDVDAFVRAAESLWEHHRPLARYLVPVLVPEKVAAADRWSAWLDRLLRRPTEGLRFVLVDLEEAPALAGLAHAHADIVRSIRADLEMADAYVQISAAAGGLDTPPGRFRHAFVQMCNAIGRNDMDGAEREAAEAKAVARAQSWAHLSFAVEFARGSGWLGVGEAKRAIACYRDAEAAAVAARDAGEDFGDGLVLKAKLGQGAACVSAEAWAPGAQVYEDATEVARRCGDARSELDALRMAAYCHERARAFEAAWQRGIEAVAVGEKMDEQTRKSSSLAHAGEGLLRVCKHPRFAGREPAVHAKMRALLGLGWRTS